MPVTHSHDITQLFIASEPFSSNLFYLFPFERGVLGKPHQSEQDKMRSFGTYSIFIAHSIIATFHFCNCTLLYMPYLLYLCKGWMDGNWFGSSWFSWDFYFGMGLDLEGQAGLDRGVAKKVLSWR
jgi:hypothetical protein